jgi:hypothetical protein
VWLLAASTANGQGSAFSYQGKLTDAGSPANGSYDLQFKLFDTPTVGTGAQQGSTITNPTVQVTAGIFTVTLDFGANVFTGADRFLEIGVRPAGSPNPFTVLSPRQPINASPYAIQTINAQQLGGLPASRFVQLDGSGNVSIGPASPTGRLTVSGAGAFDAAGAARFDLINTTTGAGFLQHVTDSGLLQFATTAGATRMVIDPIGNIGIGTITPSERLHVLRSGDYQLRLENQATGGGFWNIGQSDNIFNIGGKKLAFVPDSTNSSAATVVFTNDGQVGIGTASPSAKLTVSGAGAYNAAGAARFDLFNTTANTGFLQHVTDGGLLQFTTTSGNTRMVIDPNGNVGVGTVTPQAKLQIGGIGTNGYTLGVDGNATQTLNKFGFAKAMLHVDQSGTINRCFNSTIAGNDMSAPPCGFIVSVLGTGIYAIDFGFPTFDRFVAVTADARTVNTIVPNICYGDCGGGGPNLVTVEIIETSTGKGNLGSFTVIVY